ncbi:MAG: DUF72 domain-containing protein [Methanomassiliicoccales archaeon]|jgi:uncharacterized protein YecE (DUF72 family)
MTILIGCSGWSYDDWVGRFYPIDLAQKRGEWLRYYAGYFRTVEINSTFYRPPNDFLVNSWIKKASDLEDFEFSVKLPQIITHDSIVKGNAEHAANQAASFEKICVEPLARENLLGSVLIQLSPYFKNEGDAVNNLAVLLRVVSCDKYPYAVEFRHRSWLEDSIREIVPEALDLLQGRNVANVVIDGPGFPVTSRNVADHSYIRFHGRNYDIWYSDEKEDDCRINRYDFLYSETQLRPWVERIRGAEEGAQKVRVYFNNHGRSKAVKNAFQMMDLLSIPHRQKEIQLQDQMTLGSFDASAAETNVVEKNANLQIHRQNSRGASTNR